MIAMPATPPASSGSSGPTRTSSPPASSTLPPNPRSRSCCLPARASRSTRRLRRSPARPPADAVSAFLALASRLVLLKARSLLPSLEPLPDEEGESEEELRLRLLEYAIVRERAGQLGARLRAGERAFHREGGTIELPPRGGEVDALASAWSRVLALAKRQREEDMVAPGERYSVEQRTAEIEELIAEQERVSFATLLGEAPTVGFAVVTFIALLDLYRRGVIDLVQDELFADIVITRREPTSAQI